MMLAVMAGFCCKVKEAHFSQENGKAKAKLASKRAFSQWMKPDRTSGRGI